MSGITVKGHLYATVVERAPRVAWLQDGEGKLAIVYENETTPWSWASLPGLPEHQATDGYVYLRGVSGKWGRVPHEWTPRNWVYEPCEPVWLTSERIPEPRKP